MSIQDHELDLSEELCLPVRKGDDLVISDLWKRGDLEEKSGLLSFLRRPKAQRSLDRNEFLAAFEAFQIRGDHRGSVEILEKLIADGSVNRELRMVALARVGQTAVQNGIPLDLNPILSELGLSRKDIQAALSNLTNRRRKSRDLVRMEKGLLQAMLLDERAETVESRSLATQYLRGAHDGFEMATSLSADLKGEGGEYHLARCLFQFGSFLLKRGDMPRGSDAINACRKKCLAGDFKPLLAGALKVSGFFEEDLGLAQELLQGSARISSSFGNHLEEAEALFILGNRTASESDKREHIEMGIENMLMAADKAVTFGEELVSANYMLEAGLWSARSGDAGRGRELAGRSYRIFRDHKESEIMIRSLCIIVLCHLRSDDRKKAKKVLLDLVYNYPVKQYPASFGILKEAVSGVSWLREDKDTKELFEDEIVYTIEKEAVKEIIQRAKEAYPNEFGAMLRGIEHITHIDPVMEGAGNRNSFLFSLYSRFSQRSVEGEGVVHSHPSGSARPSRADLSMFGRFPGINIIIGYPFKEDSMAAYDRLGNRVRLEIVDRGKK